MEVFINLCQGGMSVKEYSLKFTELSKCASSPVSNRRDEMSRFVTGVLEDLEKEFRIAMYTHNRWRRVIEGRKAEMARA